MESAPPEIREHVEQFERYDDVSVLLIRWANHDWVSRNTPTREPQDMLAKEVDKICLFREPTLMAVIDAKIEKSLLENELPSTRFRDPRR